MAPNPGARLADREDGADVSINPIEMPFSAYVFKLQANMNPKHRDSTAFLRVCSGRFERDLVVKHHRLGRDIRLARPHSLVAQERSTVERGLSWGYRRHHQSRGFRHRGYGVVDWGL